MLKRWYKYPNLAVRKCEN